MCNVIMADAMHCTNVIPLTQETISSTYWKLRIDTSWYEYEYAASTKFSSNIVKQKLYFLLFVE